MLEISWVVILSAIFLIYSSTAAENCGRLSSNYFQWLNDDGFLVLPAYTEDAIVEETNCTCCSSGSTEEWQSLEPSSSCQYCADKLSLNCQGSDVYELPDPAALPSKYISLYKISGVSLIALPPKSFAGLSIERLVIENSNLTYIASDTFAGVESIKSLSLRDNTLDYLSQAGYLFDCLADLSVLSLERNGLKVLSSSKSSNMQKLEYFSLAGNPVYTLDLLFLQNSSLKFLNFSSVTFKVRTADMEDCGFSSLPSTLTTLDLSGAIISVAAIEKMFKLLSNKNITTLNLGSLTKPTRILQALLPVKASLQYLSLEGTDMSDVFPLKSKDDPFVNSRPFINLTELNLNHCNIQALGTGDVFKAFPNLSALSLSGNQFTYLDLSMFLNLPNLNYIDLSVNYISDFYKSDEVYRNLSLMDLSSVEILVFDDEESKNLFNALPNIQNLSLCDAVIKNSFVDAMQNLTDLKFLELSGTLSYNTDLISSYSNLFVALKSTLKELRFTRNSFKFSSDYSLLFSSLISLQILDLSSNLIIEVPQSAFGSALQYLKMSQNLITTWYSQRINNVLKLVDLSNNQITFVSSAMLQDFYKINYLDLSNNPLICNNQVVAMVCSGVKNSSGNGTIIKWQQYQCYDVINNGYRLFSQPKDCDTYYEELSTTSKYQRGDQTTTKSPAHQVLYSYSWTWELIFISIVSILLFSVVCSIIYMKWWNIRCYIHRYFSLKKARLLRQNGDTLMRPEVYYDVFVSYSDVDRAWVLDHLIPNIEADGDICLCFHERDFQVGLSILENIMECMDRSHSLLLIVSSAFVRSKWCQFEMHLAQYRLIETLRDQLVLVLLEDIPRKTRPHTLHHMMMTKTYLVWPQESCREDARELFWRRLKRALKPNHNYIFDA